MHACVPACVCVCVCVCVCARAGALAYISVSVSVCARACVMRTNVRVRASQVCIHSRVHVCASLCNTVTAIRRTNFFISSKGATRNQKVT